MKIVRKICCGMDIHKNLIVAAIAASGDNNVTTYIQKQFSTFNSDLLNLLNWLKSNNCFDVCMESTSKYWIPVFNILESELNIFLTHPKYVKVIRSKKTDKKDSKWIANIFKQDLLKYSFIPPKNIRELRKISHYRIKLVNKRSSERNRYQNCMTVSNIALASVSTDHLGKNCKAAMDEILKSDIITEDNLKKILKGSVTKKSDQIFQAIQNSHIESDQRFKINCTIKHMNNLDEYIQNWLVFETTSCSMCSFGYQE